MASHGDELSIELTARNEMSVRLWDARERLIAPPPPFVTKVVPCPSCGHGIDPHGSDPGGSCAVGLLGGERCACLWSPNDIANHLQEQILGRLTAAAKEIDADFGPHGRYPNPIRWWQDFARLLARGVK